MSTRKERYEAIFKENDEYRRDQEMSSFRAELKTLKSDNASTIQSLTAAIADLRKQVGLKHDEANRYVNEMIDAKARVSALSAEVERLRLPEGTLAKHGSTITIEFDSVEYAIRAFDALEYAMSTEPAALGERP